MPMTSLFRHQDYAETPPTSPHYVVRPGSYPAVGSDEFRHRMQRVGRVLREAGVQQIYLAHGTFVGTDALGVLAELARVFPAASTAVRRVIKRIVDRLAGEAGNYTMSYARQFENALQAEGEPAIPVKLFYWSSENHHIGRADGAVRLIDELAAADVPRERRMLLWGHSHAGNVFALMSTLLGGERDAVERFFAAAEIYYRWPVIGCVDIPVWNRVRGLLRNDLPLGGARLDMVTFGTPIRYGWNASGYDRLLHFIHHRPAAGIPEYRAPFPPKVDDVLSARHGDYIQQLGIAGTNVTPSMLSWRARVADHRLADLLQGAAVERSLAERFKAGVIVPDEGTSLLVDYGPPDGNIAEHLAGHAVYTQQQWMLFHAEEVASRFYADRCESA